MSYGRIWLCHKEAHGRMTGEVTRRIAQASRVFGELRSSVFTACNLSLETKQLVYQSVVLGSFCMV